MSHLRGHGGSQTMLITVVLRGSHGATVCAFELTLLMTLTTHNSPAEGVCFTLIIKLQPHLL